MIIGATKILIGLSIISAIVMCISMPLRNEGIITISFTVMALSAMLTLGLIIASTIYDEINSHFGV